MKIAESLYTYIESNLIPLYDDFDEAHQNNHVRQVINESLRIASRFGVNQNIAYTVAAYHDLGVKENRELHHLVSAEKLRNDSFIGEFFSKKDILLISDAIEDHRASHGNKRPRSIYGEIVSDADQDLDTKVVFSKCLQYSLHKHSTYTKEQHISSCYEHLRDKYGKNGYLRLWTNDREKEKQLKILRNLLEKEDYCKSFLVKLFEGFPHR